MAKICYVVHRYAPYQGGSEYYVQAMAEESQRRGHDVTVFTGEHNGDLNGVKVTSDTNIFGGINPFDLIIVHGADVHIQNMVLAHADQIKAPILYMIILPTVSHVAQRGMKHARFLGCSTQDDWNHVKEFGYLDKAVLVRHSIPGEHTKSMGYGGFRRDFEIETKQMFLSCGGFWPNKAMHELVDVFNRAQVPDTTLVLTGYANRQQAPEESEFVKVFMIEERQTVLNAMAQADLLIMHSHREGFGLVLLEAMLNCTPWAARKIAGAVELQQYGFTYTKDDELIDYMRKFPATREKLITQVGKKYVLENRLIGNTVDDIEIVLKKCKP